MAMNVFDETYRTEDSSYAVSVRVSYEPKTSLYEVNVYVGTTEVSREYFDDRKRALACANEQLLDLWLHPATVIIPIITPALPDMLDLSDDAQPTDADVQAWLIEAETRGYEEPHLSHDPEKCRCGDCLTYLAGQ